MPEPHITVNGRPRPLVGMPVHTNALDFLRGLGLTGAKEGCAEGECGACAVLVARPAGAGSRWTPVNACLVPALALDGQEVVTAEGLGEPDRLHPVQAELAERGGSQCGYCTPGLRLLDGRRVLPPRPRRRHPTGSTCTRSPATSAAAPATARSATPARPSAPPASSDPLAERQADPAPVVAPTRVDGFARPADLADALALLAEHPDATVVAGSTDWGVEANLRGRRASYVVAVDRVPELRALTRRATAWWRSVPRSPSARSRPRWATPSPCWRRSGRCSPRG